MHIYRCKYIEREEATKQLAAAVRHAELGEVDAFLRCKLYIYREHIFRERKRESEVDAFLR